MKLSERESINEDIGLLVGFGNSYHRPSTKTNSVFQGGERLVTKCGMDSALHDISTHELRFLQEEGGIYKACRRCFPKPK